jgi:DGQHR domain-containing protein
LRAQRALNKKRAESISEYMLDNRDTYVLPALTASVDKAMAFEALEGIEQLGTLHIPMSATMLINDGQHRRLAIEMALRNDETLRHETAPVQIHFDQGLQRSQQIFADINSKAVKPSSAINALYDHRNPLQHLAPKPPHSACLRSSARSTSRTVLRACVRPSSGA